MGLMPYVRPKYLDDASVLAVGYKLYFYAAGTTTKQDTYSDASLATPNPNPIILNTRGEPDNAGTPIDVYLTPGLSYKVVLATDTDIDPPTSPKWTVDGVTDQGGGGGGGGGGAGQWLTGTNAVYASDATFFLSGVDLTADFHVGRRVWLSGGQDRYGTVSVSSFGIDTSVTLVDITDAINNGAVLDPAMTTAALSIQRVDGNQGIHFRFYPGTDTGVTNYEFPIGDLRRYGAKMDGVDDNAAFVSCVSAIPSGGHLLVPDGIAIVQPIIISKSIQFTGTGTLKLQASSEADFLTFGAGSAGSSVRNITVDSNKAAQTIAGIVITVNDSDVVIESSHIINGAEGIKVAGATVKNTRIKNNHINNCNTVNVNITDGATEVSVESNYLIGASYGVRVLGSSNCTITGNNITAFLIDGIEVALATIMSFNVIISQNYVSNQSVVSTGNGISVKSSDKTLISNNILDKIKNIAIVVDRLSGTDPASVGNTVAGNTIIEPVDEGIRIGVSDTTIIVNNNLLTNGITNIGLNITGNGLSGGADSVLASKNVIGACVADEIRTNGSTANRLLGEQLLTESSSKRYSNLIFTGGSAGLVGVKGLSSSTLASSTFMGVVTWPGSSTNSNILTFDNSEPDDNYELFFPLQTLAWPSTTISYVIRTTTQLQLAASPVPPAGASRAFMLIRVITRAI